MKSYLKNTRNHTTTLNGQPEATNLGDKKGARPSFDLKTVKENTCFILLIKKGNLIRGIHIMIISINHVGYFAQLKNQWPSGLFHTIHYINGQISVIVLFLY
jgi:hypothetical protein